MKLVTRIVIIVVLTVLVILIATGIHQGWL
jgi:hypothetical protein